MKTFVVLLAILALAQMAFAAPRVTLDPQVTGPNGKEIHEVTVYSGGAGPQSPPYPSRMFIGHLKERSAADSVVYVFLTATDEDSTIVDKLLAEFRPGKWKEIRAKAIGLQYAALVDPCSFLTVPVMKDGTFILNIDEHKHPCQAMLHLVDANGTLLNRRLIWSE